MRKSNRKFVFSALLFMFWPASVDAQDVSRVDLARLLTTEAGRSQAAAFVAASRQERVPLLLGLTRATPDGVDEHDLRVGLADVFAQLRASEAISFLVRTIALHRVESINLAPWLKTAESIKLSFPSLAALISIGPDASRAVIRAYEGPMTPEERLAAIFVVSQVRNVPEAKAFLNRAQGQDNMERYFAEEGVKAIDQQ